MGGGNPIRLGRAWGRALLTVVASVALALSVASCGSSSPGPSPELAPSNLLESSDFSKYPPESVERSFLEFWSSLQFRSWAEAAAYYDPDFREYIGTTTIIGAKKVGSSVYPFLKPTIVRTTSNGDTTIYYTIRLEDGTKELASSTWRKVGGNWLMIYDSRLDGELAQFAQERVELEQAKSGELDSSQPASTDAVRAGKVASQQQARFLQQELSGD